MIGYIDFFHSCGRYQKGSEQEYALGNLNQWINNINSNPACELYGSKIINIETIRSDDSFVKFRVWYEH